MIELNTYALASHVRFFREGDAYALPDVGEAASNALPGAEDDGWIEGGDVESWEDSMAQDEEKEVRKPKADGGILVRKAIITTFQAMDFKIVTNSMTRLAFEAFYRSATKLSNAQAQFVPLSLPPRNYWMELTRYTQENELVFAANLWVRMKVTGGMKGGNGELIMPEYTCRLLDSDLNTMAFGSEAQVNP